MTGNTTIIVKSNKVILGKVRHSGYNMLDWLKEKGKNVFRMKMKNVWSVYWIWRRKRSSDVSQDCEIESKFNFKGFSFEVPPELPTNSHYFDVLQSLAESELKIYEKKIQKKNPDFYEGFRCGYGDYRILIDFDRKYIEVNGEIVKWT